MEISQFKDSVEAIGIVASGFWAAITFHKLQKVREAELGILKSQEEVRKTRTERQEIENRLRSQQPLLDVAIHVTEVPSGKQRWPKHLNVEVSLTNEGQQNFDVEFDKSVLTVALMETETGKPPHPAEVHRFAHWYIPSGATSPKAMEPRVFRVGQKRTIPFLVPISSEGIYLIQLQATYDWRPFDGDKQTKRDPYPINAIEQCYFAVPAINAARPARRD